MTHRDTLATSLRCAAGVGEEENGPQCHIEPFITPPITLNTHVLMYFITPAYIGEKGRRREGERKRERERGGDIVVCVGRSS